MLKEFWEIKRVIQKGAHPILRTSFEDFSDIDLPRYSEAYNWWDFCDYTCDHRKECCYYYNNSRKCRRFPNIPLEIYKDHIQDICEECRREFSRK